MTRPASLSVDVTFPTAIWSAALERLALLSELSEPERRDKLAQLHEDEPSVHDAVVALLHVQPFSQTLLQLELPQVADTLLSSDKLSPGTMVGPYEIESELGAGGMGIVYRARHLGYKGEVALKVLSNILSPAGRQRFALEQEHLAWFTHPSIAQI